MEENIYLTGDIFEQKKIFRNLLNNNANAQDLINIRQKLIEKKPDIYAQAAEEQKRREKEEEERRAYILAKRRKLIQQQKKENAKNLSLEKKKKKNLSPIEGRKNLSASKHQSSDKNTANKLINPTDFDITPKNKNEIDCIIKY